MSILFVVHETGRTKSLIAIARELLKKTDEKIIFLVVGEAAQNIFNNLPENDALKENAIPLSNFFKEAEIKVIDEHPLTPDQLKTIINHLNTLDISRLIIGSPSWLKAQAPFQIAEAMANKVTASTGFIYDGDFYKEYGCVYWRALAEPDTTEHGWRRKYTWLASMAGSKNLVPDFKPPLEVKVVGDPSIDDAMASTPLAPEELAVLRNDLKLKDDDVFLMVSATKKIDEDIDLVKNLLDKEDLVNHFQIRIVLHPGAKNYNHHVSAYQELIGTYSNSNIKIVLDDKIASKVDGFFLNKDTIIKSNYDREKIALAADRLCCCIPGTQATQAAISGIPVYCHLTQHISYLPKDRVDTGNDGLLEFLSEDRVKRAPLTKAMLGLTGQTTAEIVTEFILNGKPSNQQVTGSTPFFAVASPQAGDSSASKPHYSVRP